VNLLDTLTRRPEAYHEKLKHKADARLSGGAAPASIHDALGVKEANLGTLLSYDDHRRTAALDYGLERVPALADVVRSAWGERRLWSQGAFAWSKATGGVALTRPLPDGRITKTIRLDPRRPALECRIALDGVRAPVVALEFNLSLRDERWLKEPREYAGLRAFELEEQWSGIRLRLEAEPAATLMHVPIETVSESEEGLERTYQGLGVVCFWTVPAEGAWTGRLTWTAGAR
jgi:alpha-amylase